MKIWIGGKCPISIAGKILILTDVDGIVVTFKQDLKPNLKIAIRKCKEAGNDIFSITGSCYAHVRPALRENCKIVFSEHGGVRGQGKKLEYAPSLAVQEFNKLAGITTENGPLETRWGQVIIEGKRYTGTTILTGITPHYPGVQTTADFSEIVTDIEKIINQLKEKNFQLFLIHGKHDGYDWVDVTSTTKALTVSQLDFSEYEAIFTLGDQKSDLTMMQLLLERQKTEPRFPFVIPVGFKNCIEDIRLLAQKEGVYIDKHAIDEDGTAEFFTKVVEGKL